MNSTTRWLPMAAAFLISIALGAAFPFFISGGRPQPLAAGSRNSPGFHASASSDLPKLRLVPQFELTSSRGEKFSPDQLRNKVWIANFFFTSCKGPCPRLMEQLSRIYQLHRRHPDFAAVSITVDPVTDTAAKLEQYAAGLGADKSIWHFLTGPEDQIISLSNDGFNLAADSSRGHSPVFVLIDRSGTVRGYYQSSDPEKMLNLEHDLKLLLGR